MRFWIFQVSNKLENFLKIKIFFTKSQMQKPIKIFYFHKLTLLWTLFTLAREPNLLGFSANLPKMRRR